MIIFQTLKKQPKQSMRFAFAAVLILCVGYFLFSDRQIEISANVPIPNGSTNEVSREILYNVSVDQVHGYIDAKGRVVIKPQFQSAERYFVGEYAVAADSKTNLFGFIDRAGNWYIKPQYAMAMPFGEGTAVVCVNQKWGIINDKNEFIVKPRFDQTKRFVNGVAAVGHETWSSRIKREFADVGSTFNWDYFDETGKIIPDSEAKKRRSNVPVSQSYPREVYGKYGLVDEDGNFIIEPKFESVRELSGGLAAAKSDGLWGYVNHNADFVIEPRFEYASSFETPENVAIVKYDGKYGLIDITGKWIVEPKINWANEFRGGLWNVIIDKKQGYLDLKGNWVWKPTN